VFLHNHLGVDLDFKAGADQAAVGGGLAAGLVRDHAIVDDQLGHRHAPVFGCALQQSLSRVGRCDAQFAAALRNGERCARDPLVRCGACVAHDHVDAAEGDIQLICRDLGERRLGAGAQIDLADIQRDAVVLVDGQPGVQHVRGHAFGRSQSCRRMRLAAQRKAHRQNTCARCTEKLTSIE